MCNGGLIVCIHLATSTFVTFLVAPLEDNAGDAFKFCAYAEHTLNAALLFSDGKQGKEVDNLIHEFDV